MKQLKMLKEETTKHNRNYKHINKQTLYSSSGISYKDNKKSMNNNHSNKFIQLSSQILNKANELINNNEKILDLNKSYEEIEEELKGNSNSDNKKGDLFLTDLELIKQRKQQEEENVSLLDDSSKKESSYIKQDFTSFKNMLEEIENAKKQIQSEYDELNYLIKYVKDTKTSVKRHMSGVKSVINKVGANKFIRSRASFDDSVDEKAYKETGYDKTKQISKITNKLYGITSNVIGFHKNLSQNMIKIEKQNNQMKMTNNIIKYNIN
jgi:hypothetical protein